MKTCNTSPYHIVSISCLFKPLIDTNTNGNTLFIKIINTVCKYCEVTQSELKSATRKTQIVEARHLAIYFLYNYGKKTTTTSLGKYFNRDHSTIINSINVVEKFIEVDPAFKSQYDFLKREILQLIANKTA